MKLRSLLVPAAWLHLAMTPGLVSAEDACSFGAGARGFLVQDYQEKLAAHLQAIAAPGVRAPRKLGSFGRETVENTRLLQATLPGSRAPAGCAGPAEFAAIGLSWPDDFLRCVNLIDCWEGTLNKLEGSADSGDNFPNVTFGIVGFTSHDGSLQEFLQHANTHSHDAVFQLARQRLSAPDAAQFIALVEGYRPAVLRQNHADFVQLAIRNPHATPSQQKPRPEIAALFVAFETIPQFRDIQLSAARKKCWDEELPDYREALFGSPARRSLHVDLFCFDMTVLTNGPGKATLRTLQKMPWKDDRERLSQIFAAMKTTPAYRDDEEKRGDILERERCLLEGRGTVHEDDYDLRAFALLPAEK